MKNRTVKIQKKADLLDPEFWSREWEKAGRASSLRRMNVDEDRWIEFWSHVSKSYRLRIQNEEKMVGEVIRLLRKEGLIRPKSYILDIGCGPGTFSLPLARIATHVSALDPAKKMLDLLMQEARSEGLWNITPLCQRWRESSFEREFDLVLASFSPAIRNAESLLKMERASRSYCCFITASGAENFRVRNELWEKMVGEPFHSSAFHITFPFNFLYSRGIRPQLRFLRQSVSYEEPLEMLIDWYENYFKMFVDLNKPKRKVLRQYFEEVSRGGMVKTQEERTFSILWWKAEP